ERTAASTRSLQRLPPRACGFGGIASRKHDLAVIAGRSCRLASARAKWGFNDDVVLVSGTLDPAPCCAIGPDSVRLRPDRIVRPRCVSARRPSTAPYADREVRTLDPDRSSRTCSDTVVQGLYGGRRRHRMGATPTRGLVCR